MKPISDIEAICWRVVSEKGYPISTRDIHKRVGVYLKDVKEYQVAEVLRNLQQQRVVLKADNKWKVLKSPPADEGNKKDAQIIDQLCEATGIAQNKSDSVKRMPVVTDGRKKRKGRWATFRRLVDYYLDCIEQTEMPQLRAYFERENDTWIQLRSPIPWDRLHSGAPVGVPKVSREQSAFERNRMQRDEEQSLYLGYPLEVIETRDGNRWLMPILSIPVKGSNGDSGFSLSQDGVVMPNKAWMDGKFRKASDREAFQRYLGILVSDEDESGNAPDRRVGILAQKVEQYFGDKTRERFRMDQLSTPDWTTVEPGIYNACILSIGGRFRFSKSLMSELRHIADNLSDEQLDHTALATFFPHKEAKEHTQNYSDACLRSPIAHVAGIDPLNELQELSVHMALNRSLSAVTGPPGTGKSAVVRNIMLNMGIHDRSVLFASKNHRALDAVEKPLNKLSKNGPLVIRMAQQDWTARRPLHILLRELLNRPFADDANQIDQCVEQLDRLLELREITRTDLASLIEQKQIREELFADQECVYGSIPLTWRSLNYGKSIRKIVGSHSSADITGFVKMWKSKGVRRWLFQLFLSRKFKNANVLCAAIEVLYNRTDQSVWDSCIKWMEYFEHASRIEQLDSQLKELPSRNSLNEDIQKCDDQVKTNLTKAIDQLASGARSFSDAERRKMSALRAALQTFGQVRLQKEFFEQASAILKLFPLWATTSQSIKSTLPLIPGCFDLLVVDEASQCDIASTIPLLARCQRAIIVGDPMQLQHVTKLQVQGDRELLIAHDLTSSDLQRFSYRANSLFDCVRSSISGSDYVALREHFRCHPDIASFASETFYQSSLIIRTDFSSHNSAFHGKTGLQWHDVSGDVLRPGNGMGGVHAPDERKFIINALKELEQQEFDGTIGVATPFNAQKQRLADEIQQELPQVFIERTQLHVDTAHGFQGDERDVVFFSLCCGPSMPDGSRFFITQEGNLFNVAITRARKALRLVGNLSWAQECKIPFIEKCANRAMYSHEKPCNAGEEIYQSPWEKKFHEALIDAEIEVIPQYPVAGRFLDLAALKPVKLDIEVDGEAYHRTAAGNRKDDDIWRDQQLMSCGWKVCRFWVYQLKEDLDGCVRKVEGILEQ